MAYNRYSFRYSTGRAANLALLIFNRERTTLRTTGTTMTALGSVADSGWAAGRLAFTEKTSSDGTGTGQYVTSTDFPALTAGHYLLEIYDVTTPANGSPGPLDVPLEMVDTDGVVYWTGTDFEKPSYAIGGTVSGDSALGEGADEVTVNVSVSGTPVADADVWVTSDSAGDVVVAGTLQTDDQGDATFMLDAGTTYYLFAQKSGVNAIQGQSFVAVAD